jgi:ABC-type transport system substrate-binding protein
MENDGARYRIRLQPGVRFHDGRRMTARDVRHSWERLLCNRESESRWVLSIIRGAQRLIEGAATDLAGFHIVSPGEFVVELEKPVPFFPAMISYAATAIVPEGTGVIGTTARTGAIGTGAFRVVNFEPGRRLELERNPSYWRADRPRSEGIVFHFGIPPEEIRNEFVAGRLSIARDLLPADAEAFRQDPRFASGYRESPRLTTYFVIVNTHRGPLRDLEARRSALHSCGARSAASRSRRTASFRRACSGTRRPGRPPARDCPATPRRRTARSRRPCRAKPWSSRRPCIRSSSASSRSFSTDFPTRSGISATASAPSTGPWPSI